LIERGSAEDDRGAAPGGSEQDFTVIFTKRLREGVRSGRITCSVRIWTRPHVKVGHLAQGPAHPVDRPGGTVEEVRAATIACARTLAPGGTGLVLGASHRMQSDIPLRNVEAMLAALGETRA